MLELPYGRVPYPLDPGPTVLEVALMPAPSDPDSMTEPTRGRPGDPTSRRQLIGGLEVIARHLPTVRCAFELATGTHGPSLLRRLGLPDPPARAAVTIRHDARRTNDPVDLSSPRVGTPIRVHRGMARPLLSLATDCPRRDFEHIEQCGSSVQAGELASRGAGDKTRFSQLRCEAA
jgi:hypothetical protein